MAEIHVGDIGTVYRVRIRDEHGDFNPSDASVKHIVFRLPGGVVLAKEAEVVTDSGAHYLTYTVLEGDGLDGGPFHAQPGPIEIQAYLRWADGQQYHSDIQDRDDDGAKLRIVGNLRDVPA